jgi:hypothetical protein
LSGAGINASNATGLWTGEVGRQTSLVMRTGDPAPGAGTGVVFHRDFFPNPLGLNNLGQIALNAKLTGSSVTSANDTGMWSSGGGAGLELVAREGDPAAGTQNGVVFGEREVDTTMGSYETNSLNNWGQMAFVGRLTGPSITPANNSAIWAQDREGMLQLIIRTGDMLDVDDGPGVDLRTVKSLASSYIQGVVQYVQHGPKINDLGQVQFHAIFTDGSQGIFVSNLIAVPELSSIGLAVIGLLTIPGLRGPARRGMRVRQPLAIRSTTTPCGSSGIKPCVHKCVSRHINWQTFQSIQPDRRKTHDPVGCCFIRGVCSISLSNLRSMAHDEMQQKLGSSCWERYSISLGVAHRRAQRLGNRLRQRRLPHFQL